MGDLLSKPDTAKHVDNGAGASGRWPFGVSEMQGWRRGMEDAHLAMPDFDPSRQLGLFGVFDGHGGGAVARLAARRLPEVLRATPAFKEGRYRDALYDSFLILDRFIDSPEGRREVAENVAASSFGGQGDGEEDDDEMIRRLVESGEVTEEQVQEYLASQEEEEEEEEEDSDPDMQTEEGEEEAGANSDWANGEGPDGMGATAVVALVRGNEEVICANAGDSRCLLARGDRAVGLSRDHKPKNKAELARIKKAGGFVTSEGRVDGNLNLSRALGDFAYKKDPKLKQTEQKISCEAEMRTRALTAADRYLVLGCDGIFEKATNQDLVDFLLPRLQRLGGQTRRGRSAAKPLSSVCSAFLDHNIASNPAKEGGMGCDNMTLMVVDLRGTGPASARGASATAQQCAAGRVRRPIGKGARRLTVARAHRRAAAARAAVAAAG